MSPSNKPEKKSLGEKLKEVRESKGLQLRLIHEKTKIPLDVLRAIEEGYTVGVISPFYLKGFTKMYAQYLGLDPKDLEEKAEQDPLLPEEQKGDEKKEPIIKEVPKKIRFTADTKEFLSRKRQKQIVQAIGVIILLFLVFKIGGCIRKNMPESKKIVSIEKERARLKSKAEEKKKRIFEVKPKKDTKKLIDPKDKPAEKKSDAAPKKPEAQKKVEEKKVVEPAPKAEVKKAVVVEKQKEAPKKVEEKPVKKAEKVELQIKSRKRGWLQVKVDGKVVFQSTIKEGIVEKWQAKESIEISGKSIHYLDFEVNGKKLGGLSNANKNARRVVITKDGLSVKK